MTATRCRYTSDALRKNCSGESGTRGIVAGASMMAFAYGAAPIGPSGPSQRRKTTRESPGTRGFAAVATALLPSDSFVRSRNHLSNDPITTVEASTPAYRDRPGSDV